MDFIDIFGENIITKLNNTKSKFRCDTKFFIFVIYTIGMIIKIKIVPISSNFILNGFIYI